jgi:hypothetical protein
MNYDNLNAKEFLNVCLSETVNQLDIYNTINRLTNNFEKDSLQLFLIELKNRTNNIGLTEITKRKNNDNRIITNTRCYTIHTYLKRYISELEEQNNPESTIKTFRELIDTIDIEKKITSMKILVPELWKTVDERYWNLIDLYNIAIKEYNKPIEPIPKPNQFKQLHHNIQVVENKSCVMKNQNILDKIYEYLYIIEFKQDDKRLRTTEFYIELDNLFVEFFDNTDTEKFEYYKTHLLLCDICEFLAQYTTVFFEKFCPEDELTGIWDKVDRFIRHNAPVGPDKKISVIDFLDLTETSTATPLLNQTDYYGKFQFDKNTLSVLHGYFNDKLWNFTTTSKKYL